VKLAAAAENGAGLGFADAGVIWIRRNFLDGIRWLGGWRAWQAGCAPFLTVDF